MVVEVSLQGFDIDERQFVRIHDSVSINSSPGDLTQSLLSPSRVPCAKECNRQSSVCNGFAWNPVPDADGNYNCDTVQYITEDRIV